MKFCSPSNSIPPPTMHGFFTYFSLHIPIHSFSSCTSFNAPYFRNVLFRTSSHKILLSLLEVPPPAFLLQSLYPFLACTSFSFCTSFSRTSLLSCIFLIFCPALPCTSRIFCPALSLPKSS